MHTLLLLLQPLVQDVPDVIFHQRLLEALLSRGVDALTNQDGRVTEYHRGGIAGNHGFFLGNDGHRRGIAALGNHAADVFGSGATATACHTHATANHIRNRNRECLRIHVKDSLAIHHPGHAGVGLENHRDGRMGQILLHHRTEGFRAQRTIDADGVRTHALQQRHHGGGGCTRHELSVLAVCVGDHHGQITIFLDSQQCRFGLVGVIHGLDEDQVHAAGNTDLHRFGKACHCVLEIVITVGFQQTPCRTDIQRHEFLLGSCGGIPRGLCAIHRGRDDLQELLP